ncbi:uncharacterized protein LOC134442422 [Engraulis encrasicolus]|uniref:uncharacterized protein LOC134442422 n=1 Tax=Engraulis encrasicolus TaxID=184585 RepID=UPI002FD3B058
MDVYEQLWTKNKDLAEKTLNLPFFQHMQRGDLQADDYAIFMLQDITVLSCLADILTTISDMVTKPDMKAFFKERSMSYQKYVDEFLNKFNLTGVQSLRTIEPTQQYQSYMNAGKDGKKSVRRSNNEEDILVFFAVLMLARERLWLWLANQMKEGYGNAYFTWKKKNMTQWNPEKHYKKIINDNVTDLRDIEFYNSVFRLVIQYELAICAFLVPA